MPGSTIAATILFTDLVDSTRLSTSMSPEAADELRQRHFSVLREAVAAHGGNEVKNLGDGLMVVLPGPSAALDCSVAMQQAIDRHNAAGYAELAVRIGVATGEVTTEDGDYFGDAVVEAARLCAAAGGGQILTTALVRATLGRRAAHAMDRVGDLELKGLPEPVEAWEVRWAPAADPAAAVPLPGRLQDRSLVAFVGRGPERELLGSAWKEAMAGGRRVVLLSGEPGIGKTRLAKETALAAAEQGAVVLFGACDEGLGAPYRPWMEALGHLVANLPQPVLESLGSRQLAHLARVVPDVRDRLPGLAAPDGPDAETERYLFYGAVGALLCTAASVGPVVLTLDDIQWADRQSLSLLRHVVSAPECRSLLVLATFRDADVGADHPLADVLAALRREPDVVRLTLSGLEDRDLIEILDHAAREPLGDAGADLARALYRETDGNPFFAWEVVRHLAETGWASQDAGGHWTGRDLAELTLPDSVREVVGRRVARLGPETAETLAVASVLGAAFGLDPLATMTGRPPVEVLDLLERAESAGLVRSVAAGAFQFGHAIIRHTLYDQLSPTRRALLHRQAAETLEAGGTSGAVGAAELARHWAAAVTQADVGKAVAYSRQAGDEALAALAPEQAAEHYRRALELHQSDPGGADAGRCDLLCSLAEALCQSGDPSYEQQAMEAARIAQRLGDADRLVRAALIHYRIASSAYDAQRCALVESALEVVGPADSAARARLLLELALQLTFVDGPRAVALGTEARDIGRRLGDPRLLMEVVCNRYGHLWDVKNLDLAEEGVALARRLDDPAGMSVAAQHLHHDAIVWGDRERAEAGLLLLQDAVGQVGRPDLRWILGYCQADWAVLNGDLDRAETLSRAAWELAQRTGQPGSLLVRVAELQMIYWHRGRPADAEPLLAEAAAADPNFHLLHLGTGPGSAPSDLGRTIETLPVDGAWLATMAILSEQVARSGDAELIRSAYERLGPYRHLFNKQGPLTRGPVSHTMALLAAAMNRRETAASDFAAADELNRRLRAPFYTARTEVEWARFLIGGSPADRSQARQLLESALETSARHGYAGVEQRARRVQAELSG